MKRSSFVQATALVAAASFCFAVGAEAQVTKDDGKCRGTANKNTAKLSSTANKAVVGCVKDRLKGKNALASCINPNTADTKGKLPGTIGKLTGAVGGAKSKCDDTVHAAALAEYAQCPSPGVEGAMASFANVGQCLADIVVRADGAGMTQNMWGYALNADVSNAVLAGKDEAKCVNGLAKAIGKLHDTATKTLGKLQAGSDKGGGAYDYGFDQTSDDKSKISKAAGKLNDAIDKCEPTLEANAAFMNALGSCASTFAGLKTCLPGAIRKNASGISAVSFEMPGVCPDFVSVTGNGTNGGASPTVLSVGSTGLGHGAGLPNGFVGGVNLDCSADADCSTCSVTAACDNGNCRCSNDPTIVCGTPFVQDICGGGNTCDVFFGPPLALNAGGTFTCVVNQIQSELVGTADIGTGASSTDIDTAASVYITGTQSAPCPTCDSDPTANDGVAGGTCNGGQQDGGACDANFTSPTFGDTSYDCQPLNGQAIATLTIGITVSPDDKSQGFDLACGTGDPAGCPCRVCSGDPTIACNADSVCATAGAGTCSSDGPGFPTVSNSCDDLTCNAGGVCNAGTVSFCDGFVDESGGGVIACSVDGDCTALNTECPGGDCGNCTLAEARACFNDPIVNTAGQGGQDGAVLTSQFCVPPTGTGVDAGAGTPGAGDLSVQFAFVGACPTSGDEYELGGHNCP